MPPTKTKAKKSQSPYQSRTTLTQARNGATTGNVVISPQMAKIMFLFLIAIIVYIPAMSAGFIWDDDQLLTANPVMPDPWGLFKLWFAPATADYFPLTSSTLWIEWRLWGLSGPGYHVTNIIMHAFDSVLMMLTLQKLRIRGAWLAALLFAIHPVNGESVAWISERKNTLSMVFFLLTIMTWVDFEDATEKVKLGLNSVEEFFAGLGDLVSTRWYWLSLLSFFFALTSKTTVVTLPIVLLLVAWWRRGKITVKDFVASVPFFAMALLLGVVTLYFQYGRAIGSEYIAIGGFFSRLAGAGMAVWFYLWKVLWPFNLIEIYPHWDIDPPQPWMFFGGIALAVVFYVLLLARNSWGKAPLFGLSYFVITLLPVLGFLKMSYMRLTLVADHFQYLPMIGILAVVAAGAMTIYESVPPQVKQGLLCVWLVVVGGLSVMTWDRAEVHQGEESLWTDTLEKNPDTWQGQNHLGAVRYTQGNIDEAMYHFKRAVQLKPDNPEVHNNLALAWANKGHMELAVPEYAMAHKIRSDNVPIATNYANALAAVHRLDDAAAVYKEAVKMSNGDPNVMMGYANVLYQAGKLEDARTVLEAILAAHPSYPPAVQNLAALKAQEEKARQQATQSVPTDVTPPSPPDQKK